MHAVHLCIKSFPEAIWPIGSSGPLVPSATWNLFWPHLALIYCLHLCVKFFPEAIWPIRSWVPLQPFQHPGLLWPIWPISHSTPLYQSPKSFQSLPCCQWLQSLPPVLLALLLAKEICRAFKPLGPIYMDPFSSLLGLWLICISQQKFFAQGSW